MKCLVCNSVGISKFVPLCGKHIEEISDLRLAYRVLSCDCGWLIKPAGYEKDYQQKWRKERACYRCKTYVHPTRVEWWNISLGALEGYFAHLQKSGMPAMANRQGFAARFLTVIKKLAAKVSNRFRGKTNVQNESNDSVGDDAETLVALLTKD